MTEFRYRPAAKNILNAFKGRKTFKCGRAKRKLNIRIWALRCLAWLSNAPAARSYADYVTNQILIPHGYQDTFAGVIEVMTPGKLFSAH